MAQASASASDAELNDEIQHNRGDEHDVGCFGWLTPYIEGWAAKFTHRSCDLDDQNTNIDVRQPTERNVELRLGYYDSAKRAPFQCETPGCKRTFLVADPYLFHYLSCNPSGSKNEAADGLSLPSDNKYLPTAAALPSSDAFKFTIVHTTNLNRPSERTSAQTVDTSPSTDLILILWRSGVSRMDSGVFLQVVLVLVAPCTVRLLWRQLRINLGGSEYKESLQERSEGSFNIDHCGDFDVSIVTNQVDRQQLLNGRELPLERCSHFIQERADAIRKNMFSNSFPTLYYYYPISTKTHHSAPMLRDSIIDAEGFVVGEREYNIRTPHREPSDSTGRTTDGTSTLSDTTSTSLLSTATTPSMKKINNNVACPPTKTRKRHRRP